MKQINPKTCKECDSTFKPMNTLQKVCSPGCAITLATRVNGKKRKKEFNAETKRRKDAAKTRSDWLNELQTVVNRYVRLRDKGKPCISCDKPDNGQHQRHASHFKSVGSNSALRYNLHNIHASCSSCNNHLSGNIAEYIPRLRRKIGGARYDWLLTQNHTVKYDIDYIKRFKRIFNKRCRILERRLK